MSASDSTAVLSVPNALLKAKRAMTEINPSLVDKFVRLIEFLIMHPELAATKSKDTQPEVRTIDYIERQALNFAEGRKRSAPGPPKTKPDDLVSKILNTIYQVPLEELSSAIDLHGRAMQAENYVGTLLEEYIASVIEPLGWIWCSGATVKHVDFIKPPATSGSNWRMLQVKNRDNSENSSSSRVRLGTDIEKWHRTKSRTGATMWHEFPDENAGRDLSEESLFAFVDAYSETP